MLIIVKTQLMSTLQKHNVWRIKRMHVPLTYSMLPAFIDVVDEIVYFVVRYCQINVISSSRLFYRLWY